MNRIAFEDLVDYEIIVARGRCKGEIGLVTKVFESDSQPGKIIVKYLTPEGQIRHVCAERVEMLDPEPTPLGCDYDSRWEEGRDEDEERFADPGGDSALWAASDSNPRNLPCPTCGEPNRLTPKDVAAGYQCDTCANQLERGGY